MTAVKVIREAYAVAPATVGNFFAGFDVLGAAVESVDGSLMGDIVRVRERSVSSGASGLKVEGAYASLLPLNPRQNLVIYCRDAFHRLLSSKGVAIKPLQMILHKNLPLASGLGSSASSIVAALSALNAFYSNPLTDDELLSLAGKAEGSVSGSPHLDNVAPALLGGLQFIAPDPENSLGKSVALPMFDNWKPVVVHPHLAVQTKKARAVLPRLIPLKKAVEYWQNLGAFIQALFTKNQESAIFALRDLLIEKHRKKLVKGFSKVQSAAIDAGAMSCTFSGSGPSMVAVATTSALAEKVRTAMISAFRDAGIASEGWICRLNLEGAVSNDYLMEESPT